jgi:tetratricopeptide (TPR) repeat protein
LAVGKLLFHDERWEEARDKFLEFLNPGPGPIKPDFPQTKIDIESQKKVAYDRGLDQLAKGDYSGAAKSFQEVLNLQRDYKDAGERLDYALLLKEAEEAESGEEWMRAADKLKEALKLKPKAEGLAQRMAYDRGMGQLARGDHSGAAKSFQEVLNLQRDYRDAVERLNGFRRCGRAVPPIG